VSRSAERGSASVWVLALAGVLALIGLAVALVGLAAVARHRATAAADLAALAAAGGAVEGEADPCAGAATVAVANGASLRTCTVDPAAVADVAVVVPVDLGPLGVREATARARAGPVPGPAPP
jgi:secretion/DNA translocation related TadE-like protein